MDRAGLKPTWQRRLKSVLGVTVSIGGWLAWVPVPTLPLGGWVPWEATLPLRSCLFLREAERMINNGYPKGCRRVRLDVCKT